MLFTLLALAALPAALGAAMLSSGEEDDTEIQNEAADAPKAAADPAAPDLLDEIFSEEATEGVPSDGNDTLIGTAGSEQIEALRGDDRIDGFEGDDTLLGGWGDDLIYAGPGDDLLGGGAGDDTLIGGAGDDLVIFGPERGPETAMGATQVDLGSGADSFYGLGGAEIDAGAGTAPEAAGDGNADQIELWAGNGQTKVIAHFEAGRDVLQLWAEDGQAIDPESLAFVTEGEDLHLELDGSRLVSLNGLGGAGLAQIFGGDGAPELPDPNLPELIEGTSAGETLDGGGGNDTIHGSGGNDLILGGWGNDLAYAGPGDDRLEGAAGDDTLFGGIGDDTLLGGLDQDHLVTGTTGFDLLDGGEGNDLLLSHSTDGGDTFIGGAGDDTIDLAHNRIFADNWFGNHLAGGAGDDHLTASLTGFDTLKGGSGDDTLISGAGAISGDGAAGASSLDGGAGNDHLIGLAEGDTLIGGIGRDLIDGTAASGMDLRGGSGADTILSGLGNTVTLGNDADHVSDALVLDLSKGSGITTITDFDLGRDGLTVQGAKGALSLVDTEDASAALLLDGDTVVARLDGLAGTSLDQLRPAGSTGLATSGDDTILGGIGDDTLLGGAGDDRITDIDEDLPGAMEYEYGAFDVPVADDDLLSGGDGNDTLIGNNGADTLLGGAGDDVLVDELFYEFRNGGFDYALDDPAVMDGGAGDDVLIGSPGDTMTGGTGADAFALHVDGLAPIVITDFTPGEDVLHLEAEYGDLEGVTNFTQEVLADGSGLKIYLPSWINGRSILLMGVTAPLDAASFPQAFATAEG
ncbi:MAG: hypothetical protein IE922_02315 [Sphingomonadales bacterium]|nr:hypothetical protein [Sphingomonadales bacterium]